MYFDDEVSIWYLVLMKEDEDVMILSSWRNYKSRFKERFKEIMDDLMVELKELKETEGIVEYYKKFEFIRIRFKMFEEYLLSVYLVGLYFDIQMYIRMFNF